jgi:hypothetical protein
MNRLIVLVSISLCAGCASTASKQNAEAEQLAARVQLEDSRPTCSKSEVLYCQATRASHFQTYNASSKCGCVPKNAFGKTAPPHGSVSISPGTKVR